MTNKNKTIDVVTEIELPMKFYKQLNKLSKKTGASIGEVVKALLERGFDHYKQGDAITVILLHSLHLKD